MRDAKLQEDIKDTKLPIYYICGVPQRSFLGQILFQIYINDLFKASNLLLEIMLADDSNGFTSFKNINTLFATKKPL